MRRRARALVKASALILFGTAIGLLPLEVGMRLAGVGGPAELGSEYDRPRTGYAPQAERQRRWRAESDAVRRVAVVGDSFTVGFGNQWYDAYPNRLEYLLNLNADAVPVEVRAFAKTDTTTWEQQRFLDEVIAWQPDLLILGLFLNDTEDPLDPGLDALRGALAPRIPSDWARRMLRASRLAAWIYLRLEQMRSHRAALDLQEYVFDPEYSGMKRFRQAVRVFAETCRQSDVRLVAVVWPSMGGLGPSYPHHLAHTRINEVLAEARVPTLDLLAEFSEKSSERLAIYPGIDNHPNEIAHRIAATAIYRFLLRSRSLDRSYKSGHRHHMPPSYWLRRVRRQRSPLYFDPVRGSRGSAAEAGQDPPSDD